MVNLQFNNYNPCSKNRGRGRPKLEVDPDLVKQLYTEKRMSVREVALRLGVSPNTVTRRLAENNSQLRGWRLPGEL